MLREVVYRLIESFASKRHSSIWKLICGICVCNTLAVGVHLSSTPSISGPGSATGIQVVCAPITDLDHPARPCSLIRPFHRRSIGDQWLYVS